MASWARIWEAVRFTAQCYGGHVASPGRVCADAGRLVGTCAAGRKWYQS